MHEGGVESTNLTFPTEIKKRAILAAQKERLSLSQWIVALVEKRLKDPEQKKV